MTIKQVTTKDQKLAKIQSDKDWNLAILRAEQANEKSREQSAKKKGNKR